MRLLACMLLLMLLQLCSAYNYCHNSTHLCDLVGEKHFICEKHQPYLNKTKYVGTIPDTLRLRKIILSYYNKYRNEVASGTLTTLYNKTFPPACRMRELIWDVELAYTARIHAETVSFKHSLCRSVLRFPYAGECIGIVRPISKRRSIKNIMDRTIRFMFETYFRVEDPEQLISFFRVPQDLHLSRFTILISDRVSRVGCAIVVATDCMLNYKYGYCYLITCHFDFIMVSRSFTYKPGEPTSNCSDWESRPSNSFRNLCRNTGKIFPVERK
ncbi:antigen 5 like allergen Cul n 1-like isoform X1 [Drosophila sulfurigaster albostrigata]|uniref:antigen 5 like allergen Cul n 1-like isoform X1 n=1 Tax=Drosophila sulfurigaster albostrigata TaxID=89887 RepID=UPI002D21CA39|nr:antigen 5 like allergen Cul n 1-like isoform X1 [Drosophila sulfurigaster albostrigata]